LDLRFRFSAFLLAIRNSSSDDSDEDKLISTTFFAVGLLLAGFFAGLAAALRALFCLFEPLPSVFLTLGDIQPSSSAMARVAFGVFFDAGLVRFCRIGKATMT
jgi:hypothetical protein